MSEERRRFARILYLTTVNLTQEENKWQASLLDLSLQGALISRPATWTNSDNKEYELSFMLDESDIEIKMLVTLNHEVGQRLGFQCHHMDINSITHLKRMIELNVGDTKLVYRELDQLLQDHIE